MSHTIEREGRDRVKIELHVFLHQQSGGGSNTIEAKVDKVLINQGVLMAAVDDLKAELVAANAATNEIAADITDLVSRLGSGSLSPAEAAEVQAELTALKVRLQGVASTHTTV